MADSKKPRSENTVADDNIKKRSIDVPDEIWAHVERWAKKQDKSKAAIVRSCIEHVHNRSVFTHQITGQLFEFQMALRKTGAQLEQLLSDLTDQAPNEKTKKQIEKLHQQYRSILAENARAFLALRQHKLIAGGIFPLMRKNADMDKGPDT